MTKQELQTLVNVTRSKYYISVMPFYTIAECAIYDAWNLAKGNKTKGAWKMWLREAYRISRTEGVDIVAKRELKDGYDLVLDVGDRLQDRLARELQLMKIAISNIIINATAKDCDLKKSLVFAQWSYEFCVQMHDAFFRGFREKYKTDISPLFEKYRQTEAYAKVVSACKAFCADCLDALSAGKPKLTACENTLLNKWSSEDFINMTIRDAMIANGNYDDVIKQLDAEGEKMRKEELGINKLKEKYKVNERR